VFGVLGLAGITFLGVGFLLAQPWTAEREIAIGAQPDQVFPYLDSLALWDEWTVWGDVASEFSGPGRGAGARRSWDDPQYGEGVFEIVESQAPRALRYEVLVEEGALRIHGRLVLEPDDSGRGTRLHWSEEGDFGRNPLLGWVAGSMGRSQSQELDRSLARLKTLIETGTSAVR
jgi:hypothetical protein